jgi:hypothetical protein
MCDAYFDSGKYRGPETDPDGWHVRAVLGMNNDENVVILSLNHNRTTGPTKPIKIPKSCVIGKYLSSNYYVDSTKKTK